MLHLLSFYIVASTLLLGGSLARAEPVVGEDELLPPAIPKADERRLELDDLLDLHLCTNNHQETAYMVLTAAILRILDVNGDHADCDYMKAALLPTLQRCVLETGPIKHTIYAGAVFDAGFIYSHSSVRGVYMDSDGRFGCFNTACQGWGATLTIGVGAVGGVLLGDSVNDFPGAALGGEIGGDAGQGFDIAWGMTSGGKPYAEISAGLGAGFAVGIQVCETETHGEVDLSDWTGSPGYHCGGDQIDFLANGIPNAWHLPSFAHWQLCELMCDADPECEGFVWREQDEKCFWKSGVTSDTLYPLAGHTCHRATIVWIEQPEMHCGGTGYNPLHDGTPYGWTPPNLDIRECEVRCAADAYCVAFVWHNAKCHWKEAVDSSTPYTLAGHTCYRPRGDNEATLTPAPAPVPAPAPAPSPCADGCAGIEDPVDRFRRFGALFNNNQLPSTETQE